MNDAAEVRRSAMAFKCSLLCLAVVPATGWHHQHVTQKPESHNRIWFLREYSLGGTLDLLQSEHPNLSGDSEVRLPWQQLCLFRVSAQHPNLLLRSLPEVPAVGEAALAQWLPAVLLRASTVTAQGLGRRERSEQSP